MKNLLLIELLVCLASAPKTSAAQLTLLGAGAVGGASAPTLVPLASTCLSNPTCFTATDGAGTSFNQSTIAVTVGGPNPMLVACWHSEFADASKSYRDDFVYNGVLGRLFYDTRGYHDANTLRCAYWIGSMLTTGTHDLVVTLGPRGVAPGNAQELTVQALLFNNVAPVLYPFRDTQKDISTSNRSSETETLSSTASDLVVHIIASSLATAGTLGSGETAIVNANDATDDASLYISTKAGGASTTTVSSSGWASTFNLQGLAFSIKGPAAVEDHTLYTSTFAGGDETPISEAGKWTRPAGSQVGNVGLVSHKAKGVGAAAENVAQLATPSFAANQRCQMKLLAGGNYARCWVRSSNSGGYILTFADASDIQIIKVTNSGSSFAYNTLQTFGTNFNFIAPDLIELEAVGTSPTTTLNVYWNSQLVTSVSDSSSPFTSGQPGLGSYDVLNITDAVEATTLPVRN